MPDKNKLQEKYVQLQLMGMQIKQIEEQLEAIDQRASEMVHLRDSLKKFATIKTGTKSFVPLGQGMFTEASVGSTNEVLINVGSDIIVRKSTEEAEKTIASQLTQLQDITLELSNNLQLLATKAQELEQDISATE